MHKKEINYYEKIKFVKNYESINSHAEQNLSKTLGHETTFMEPLFINFAFEPIFLP